MQSLEGKPTDSSIEGSRKEAETVLFDIVAKALKKTNVKAKDIDILVVNCSLFSPTPSLCAMIVSKVRSAEGDAGRPMLVLPYITFPLVNSTTTSNTMNTSSCATHLLRSSRSSG